VKNLSITYLLATALLFAGVSAHAAFVVLDGTNATAINNLDIGGTAYDVTFDFVQADTAPVTTCGTVPCDVFFGDETTTIAAVDAINAALNSASTVAETVGSAHFDYFVPFAKRVQGPNSEFDSWQGIVSGGVWGTLEANGVPEGADTIEFARFSPAAAVPIPPAAWLFGSALGILGWIRRRTSNVSRP